MQIKKPIVLTITILMISAMIIPAALAELTTDKPDYAPDEPVNIAGTDFLPNSTVTLTLRGPEGFTDYVWDTTADENGTIQTTYGEGLMDGSFTLEATDGTTPTQTTTFTDTGWQVNFATIGLGVATSITITYSGTSPAPSGPLTFTSPGPSGYIPEGTNNRPALTYSGFPSNVDLLAGVSRYHLVSTNPASPFATGNGQGYTTVNATYVLQYKVTFDASSNVKTDGTGTVVTVNGTTYAAGVLPVDLWVTDGDGVSYAFSSSVDSDSSTETRYSWSSTSGTLGQTLQSNEFTVSGAGTVVGNYATQYLVTFYQTGVGTDYTASDVMTVNDLSYDRDGVSFWADDGNSTTFTYKSPLVVTTDVKQYALISVNATSPITIHEPRWVVGDYKTQWNLTVRTSGLDGATTNVYNGSDVLGTATDATKFSMWVDDGDYLNLNIDPNIGQYAFTSWSGSISGTTRPYEFTSITGALDITANYETLPTSELSVITSRGGKELESFRLIFTNDPTNPTPGFYKVTATNPGQFAYNVFYTGTAGTTPNALTITLPIPFFVTQGANPVHIFDGVSITDGHYNPAGNGITNQFTIVINTDGTITITPNAETVFPSTGLIYVLVHVDYGLKGQGGYTIGGVSLNDAISHTTNPNIPDLKTYTFSVNDGDLFSDSQEISSTNVFKNDPGVAGLVLDEYGTGVKDAIIQISFKDGKTQVTATVTTDEDGFYMMYYKYTGKPTTFTVKLLKSDTYASQTTSVTLKANSYASVSFAI